VRAVASTCSPSGVSRTWRLFLATFTKETGIKATYDIHDSNEVLESKLMTGNTGYDVVSPSNHFLSRLIEAGAIQKLDKNQLPNWKNLDPALMKKLEVNDPGNQYGYPYMWGTAGIGYNVEKIKAIFGNTDVTRSWRLFFDENNIKKLSQCGVAIIDNPTQVLPITLNYLGLPPHSHEPADYKKAEQALLKIRPYMQYFHASKYISNSVHYANPNLAADQYVVPAVKQDLAIYPPSSVLDKLFTVEELPAAIARLSTRLWTRLKTNT
jgi:putrescine transport system substrate-binding protein